MLLINGFQSYFELFQQRDDSAEIVQTREKTLVNELSDHEEKFGRRSILFVNFVGIRLVFVEKLCILQIDYALVESQEVWVDFLNKICVLKLSKLGRNSHSGKASKFSA